MVKMCIRSLISIYSRAEMSLDFSIGTLIMFTTYSTFSFTLFRYFSYIPSVLYKNNNLLKDSAPKNTIIKFNVKNLRIRNEVNKTKYFSSINYFFSIYFPEDPKIFFSNKTLSHLLFGKYHNNCKLLSNLQVV
jgi:hypothetical protein